jgi:hypothetical protein
MASDAESTTKFDKVEPANRADAPRCPQCGGAIGMLTLTGLLGFHPAEMVRVRKMRRDDPNFAVR